jgi:hypothetical protein
MTQLGDNVDRDDVDAVVFVGRCRDNDEVIGDEEEECKTTDA